MSLSVKNTLSLRNFYSANRDFVVKSKREEATKGALSSADATALRRAVKALGDYDYKDKDTDAFHEKLKAFIDTYNYTVDSAAKGNDQDAFNTGRKIKNLTRQYQNELSNLGVSIDKDGYLSISDSAKKNFKNASYEDLFGKDSEYMSSLSRYAQRITNHVNVFA